MMQLKHLGHDPDLAAAILSQWDYDRDQAGLLERFRISANAVYPFEQDGVRHFLRFAPAEEKSAPQIAAELDYLGYLRERGFAANQAVPSRAGRELEVVDTPAGPYCAVVFAGVGGRQLNPPTMREDCFAGWGWLLGKLHSLSAEYEPGGDRRIDWRDQLAWAEDQLRSREDDAARAEAATLRERLSDLPADGDNFGLIHYDFEPDSVFWDPEARRHSVIDFDDSIYHWYALDINNALNSVDGVTPAQREAFIRGYRSAKSLDGGALAAMPLLDRYAKLVRFARIKRSLRGAPAGPEPAWLPERRDRLQRLAAKDSGSFGRPLGNG